MNKLKTDNIGGVSFEWDDWRWEQDGVREAFFGLVSAWGIDPADSFIISGCGSTLNGLNYDIDAGFLALNGEIYKVNAHSVVVALGAGDVHFWDVITSFDPTGLEPTKNAGTVNTYEIRQANVVNGTIPVPSFMPMLAETIHKKIADNVKPFFGAWTTIDLNGSNNVVQNDAKFGVGNDIALNTAPISGSYIKYQITGKTVNIQVFLNRLVVTDLGLSEAFTININSLPFVFKTGQKQSAMYNSEGTHLNGNNGIHFLDLSSNKIIFEQQPPSGNDDRTSFNRAYELQPTQSKNYQFQTNTGATTWTIRANFTAEID